MLIHIKFHSSFLGQYNFYVYKTTYNTCFHRSSTKAENYYTKAEFFSYESGKNNHTKAENLMHTNAEFRFLFPFAQSGNVQANYAVMSPFIVPLPLARPRLLSPAHHVNNLHTDYIYHLLVPMP